MKKTVLGFVAAIISTSVLSSCTTGEKITPGPTVQDCPEVITISGLTYVQNSCKVKVGASVTISASTSHPLSGSGAGKTITSQTTNQTIAFAEKGKFDYVCDFHTGQGMKGSITVE
jgi:plastocyanin